MLIICFVREIAMTVTCQSLAYSRIRIVVRKWPD